jgi:hypothetical protein
MRVIAAFLIQLICARLSLIANLQNFFSEFRLWLIIYVTILVFVVDDHIIGAVLLRDLRFSGQEMIVFNFVCTFSVF